MKAYKGNIKYFIIFDILLIEINVTFSLPPRDPGPLAGLLLGEPLATEVSPRRFLTGETASSSEEMESIWASLTCFFLLESFNTFSTWKQLEKKLWPVKNQKYNISYYSNIIVMIFFCQQEILHFTYFDVGLLHFLMRFFYNVPFLIN